MSEGASIRFSVVTSAQLESGMTIGYLMETTGLRIQSIYLDTMQQFKTPRTRKPGERRARWFRDPRTTRLHAGLALSMPRYYLFNALERVTAISEWDFLYRLERISPGLVDRYVGASIPRLASGKPLLRKLSEVARDAGIPLHLTPSLNSDETVAALAAEKPDVVIGLGTRILSTRLLSTARIGFLNGHSSILPDYRGGASEFWQLACGEQETGVTIHWMAPRVDEGSICATRRWQIPEGFNHHRLRMLSLFNRLDVWREVVARVLAGEIPHEPQGPSRTPTCRAPTLEQLYEYYREGKRPEV